MNRTVRFSLLAALLPALASCGSLVGSFIPEQTVNNPAGLNGAKLTSSPMTAAAVRGTLEYSTTTAFQDVNIEELRRYANVSPSDIRLNAQIASAEIGGDLLSGCAAPASTTLTIKDFEVVIREAGDASKTAKLSGAGALNLTLTRGSSDYSVSANSFTLSAVGGDALAFFNVLTTGGNNQARLSANVVSDDDRLLNCRVTFTIDKATAVISKFR